MVLATCIYTPHKRIRSFRALWPFQLIQCWATNRHRAINSHVIKAFISSVFTLSKRHKAVNWMALRALVFILGSPLILFTWKTLWIISVSLDYALRPYGDGWAQPIQHRKEALPKWQASVRTSKYMWPSPYCALNFCESYELYLMRLQLAQYLLWILRSVKLARFFGAW